MFTRQPFSLLAAVSLLLAGCVFPDEDVIIVDPPPDYAYTYEPCSGAVECIDDSHCEYFDTVLPEGVFSDAMCTPFCGSIGPASPSCPRGITGSYGSCYPNDVAGGIDDLPVCFERCVSDADCFIGFVCATDFDLPGIAVGDRICVPGPF